MNVNHILCCFIVIIVSSTVNNTAPNSNGGAVKANGFIMQQSVCKCILQIAKTYFVHESNIGVISSNFHNLTNQILTTNSYNIIAAAVMTEMRWTIVMKDGSKFARDEDGVRTVYCDHCTHLSTIYELQIMAMEKIHNYIIMLKSEAEVVSNLKMLTKTSSWNPHAKFLVFVDWLARDWRAFTHFIIEQFRLYLLIDFVICIPTSETDAHPKVLRLIANTILAIKNFIDFVLLQLVTWFPYNGNNCEIQITDFVELGMCDETEIIPAGIDLFPAKVHLFTSTLIE